MIKDYSLYQKLNILPNFTNKFFVYELIDPRNHKVKYIGITNNLKVRYSSHIYGRQNNYKKFNWIKELKQLNLKPIMRIVHILDNLSKTVKCEQDTIFKIGLNNLLNISPGGLTPHFLRRISIVGMNVYTKEKKYYASLTEAEKDGFNLKNISSCLNKKKKTHKNFIWVKQSEENSLQELVDKHLIFDPQYKQRKPIIGINLFTGEKVKFNSAIEIRHSQFGYKSVRKAIQNNSIYANMIWSFNV